MKRLLLVTLLIAPGVFALDGKWTPQQVLKLDPAWLAKQGLVLSPARLWDPKTGTGLLAAAISTGGCSAGFVSPDGLFVTNHHCLFSVLQENATPQNDVIANGHLARTQEAELKSKTLRVTAPRRFVDVTGEVLGAVPAGATDVERHRAIRARSDAIVAECEKQPATRCRVAEFDGGVSYVLQEMAEFDDVRLVYAPPRAVGEFGGEIDNWMWPRHTGDFSVGRVYVGGKPYRPPFHFPVSQRDLDPGDFVMVLGYPGITYRSLTAAEMSERVKWFEIRRDMYGAWIRILEETPKGDPAGTIAVADTLKTLHNRYKNAQGQLAGFRRGNLLGKQRAAEKDVLTWAVKRKEHADAPEAHGELSKLAAEQIRTSLHDRLVENIRVTTAYPLGPKSLVFAGAIARSATERRKPEGERDDIYTTRNLQRTRDRLERDQKSFHAPSDKALLADFVKRALTLPEDQRIAAIDATFSGADEKGIREKIDAIYAGTKLFDVTERNAMFAETAEQLRARKDPLVDLGFGIAEAIDRLVERAERWSGAINRLRPEWRKAVIAHAGKPVAPDANSTLRVSFAHVQGYEPRDGLKATPQTRLGGIVEKHTGEEPFDTPAAILEAAEKGRHGRWKDPELNDVPVNFLADADTTGGNSGSPVLNGRGELVGLNFDRVWENVANDFGFNPAIARNVTVDVRYMLWILEEIEKADELLRELGVKK